MDKEWDVEGDISLVLLCGEGEVFDHWDSSADVEL